MKIYAYEVREDEKEYFEKWSKAHGIEIVFSDAVPSLDTASLAAGCEAVTTLGQGNLNRELLSVWKTMGIRAIATRTIGSDHIDKVAAEELGIQVCAASYAPDGVADFTIMLILMCLRNYKQAMWRGYVNDFSLQGLMGRNLSQMTVGVLGTGRIGRRVMQDLSGFGCKLLCYDLYQNEEAKRYAAYADLDTIWRECDIITLHLPLTEDTRHIICADTLAKMKDGVILINAARGELMKIDDLVDGIESEKIGALGIDTMEGEKGIIHKDHRVDILANRNLFYLHQFRNVIMTQHMAFYTAEAIESMVVTALDGITEED